MKKEQILSLIGIAIFLIVTTLTYGIVTPVKEITNATNNTTNAIDNNSRLTNDYHIMIAITAGIVIAIVAIFLLTSW